MVLQEFCQWLEDSSVGLAIRSSESLFPVLESLHVVAITLVMGTIALVDLRLLGWGSTQRPISKMLSDVLPLTRASFIVAVTTGGLLFTSAATRYIDNGAFQLKMLLLLLAAINITVFHFVTIRDIERWDTASTTAPQAVKLAGGVSLAVWVGIVATGRWIGFL
jgi:hypothetical protein